VLPVDVNVSISKTDAVNGERLRRAAAPGVSLNNSRACSVKCTLSISIVHKSPWSVAGPSSTKPSSAIHRGLHRAAKFYLGAEMLKYAGELRVGDVWTERTEGSDTRDYRVIAVERGLAPVTITVTGSCVTTGQRRMMDFFTVNRVEVREEP
jgi:hypothetical protein